MMPSKIKVKGWKLMGWKHNGKIGSDVGPLSRKARVQQWKSNGKIAVSMCDHYGVEPRK
jgi:hypothetical protein